MSQWQPIETAPKDGTSVMLYPHYVVSEWNAEMGGFTDWSDALDGEVLHRIKFTHWMPLPAPPTSDRGRT